VVEEEGSAMERIKKIEIVPIAHGEQRYETCGDWIPTNDGIKITVSDTGDDDVLFLVGIHELIEWYLCRKKGITDEVVSAFDKRMLAEGYDDEPGDHPEAPYRLEHGIATDIEKILATQLGVDWEQYGRQIDALFANQEILKCRYSDCALGHKKGFLLADEPGDQITCPSCREYLGLPSLTDRR
jgi:hypothetical protein